MSQSLVSRTLFNAMDDVVASWEESVQGPETFDAFLKRMALGQPYSLPEFPTAEELAFDEERRRFILGAEDNCEVCGTCPCQRPCSSYDYEESAPTFSGEKTPFYSWEEPEYVPTLPSPESLAAFAAERAKEATDDALWEQLREAGVYKKELEELKDAPRLNQLLITATAIQEELTSRFYSYGSSSGSKDFYCPIQGKTLKKTSAEEKAPEERHEPYIPSWKELYEEWEHELGLD